MTSIIQKLSSLEDVPALIDASQIAYAAFRSTFPGATWHEEPGLLWFETGVPLAIFNRVVCTQLPPDALPATIERVLAHFQSRHLPFEWNIGPSSHAQNLHQLLPASGIQHEEDEPGMVADLYALNEDLAPVPNLVIQEVTTDEQIRQWAYVWGCGAPAEISGYWYTLYKGLNIGPDSPAHLYLGLLDGQPVATSALFLAAGVAAVHHVVTIPSVRRIGIGAAMTLKAAQEARRHNYHIAILTSSVLGANIYRRLGFRECCTFSTYVWEPAEGE